MKHSVSPLTSDKYFQSGHQALKIRQTILALVSWMVIFFPIFWVFLPLCNQQLAHKLGIAYFSDEFKLVNFLALFFGTFFVFITGFFIIVTIWNNLHFKHAVAQKETNRSMMRSRRGHVVELACQQHFGDKAQRQAAHFYQVEGNQNFDNNYIQNLFELNEVDQ